MSFFTGDNLRAITSGRWLKRPTIDVEPIGVGIDTRADLTDRVFVAVKGENHDGHDYLAAAAGAGAVLAIVQREFAPRDLPNGLGVLLVADTRQALARLALAYRRTLAAAKVIAITGSCGKTTTKRIIHAVLSGAFSGTAARKSFNNDIGVPLTILDARPTDRYLVVEIGANAPGEIAHLARIAEPDIAVITSVGRAHLQGFGTVEAVAREKGSLLASLAADGLAVVNVDAPLLERYARAAPSVLLFGESEKADLRLTARGRSKDGFFFEINNRTRFDFALPGRHNALNALAAVGIGRRFGLADEQISAALAAVEGEPMRLTITQTGPVRVYDDAYNANPDSMDAALETFAELEGGASRRIVVLGDMLELGEDAAELHREVGRRLIELDVRAPIDRAVLIGPLSAHIAEELAPAWRAWRYTVLAEADDVSIAAIARTVKAGDAVLVKASRLLALERLVEAIHQRAARMRTPAARSRTAAKKKKKKKRRAGQPART